MKKHSPAVSRVTVRGGALEQVVNLPVMVLREGKRFVAFSPALDLSTSGKNVKEVQRRFGEVVGIFLKELVEHGTMDEVLLDLGWMKVQRQWQPPTLISPAESISIRVPVGA